MYGPGYDPESVPALVASGCQLVCFTTGRGSVLGNAIAPVVKIATNSPMYRRMSNDMDINAGDVAGWRSQPVQSWAGRSSRNPVGRFRAMDQCRRKRPPRIHHLVRRRYIALSACSTKNRQVPCSPRSKPISLARQCFPGRDGRPGRQYPAVSGWAARPAAPLYPGRVWNMTLPGRAMRQSMSGTEPG